MQLLTFVDILGKRDINSSVLDSYFQIVFLSSSDIMMLDLDHVLSPVCSETHLAEKYIFMDIFVLSLATPLALELYCPNSITIWGFKHSYHDTEMRML